MTRELRDAYLNTPEKKRRNEGKKEPHPHQTQQPPHPVNRCNQPLRVSSPSFSCCACLCRRLPAPLRPPSRPDRDQPPPPSLPRVRLLQISSSPPPSPAANPSRHYVAVYKVLSPSPSHFAASPSLPAPWPADCCCCCCCCC